MNEQVAADLAADCAAAITDIRPLEVLRSQRVLVTGGTGFMGTWLAEMVTWLNDAHDYDIELILLSPAARAFETRAPHLAARRDLILVEQDVRDLSSLPDRVSYIIHAAGTPDNRTHARDPLRTMSVIAHGASTVFQAAARSSVLRKVLSVSSGLVYGPQPLDLERVPETFVGGPRPDSISSIYAEAKRFAEAETAAWRSTQKLPVVIARPFAFMGPHQALDKPWAVNNFLRDALLGVPIRILGDADTVRSYMYPSDMAYWLLVMLAEGTPGTAYNVGSPEGITLRELANRIADGVPGTSSVLCRQVGEPQLTRFVPDVFRAKSELGLTMTVGIERAIERTIAWHRATGGLA
ncbi:MAG: NAD-dependent epimerase/dehydratase family protein [Actinobacteria bacterium]|nr:NAD-dependent epimerase/dehydratase family protein [Actinomycetota bacterium]